MVDILALALSHGLLLLAAWRLLWRPDLDVEGADAQVRPPRRGMRVNRPLADSASGDTESESDGDA